MKPLYITEAEAEAQDGNYEARAYQRAFYAAIKTFALLCAKGSGAKEAYSVAFKDYPFHDQRAESLVNILKTEDVYIETTITVGEKPTTAKVWWDNASQYPTVV